MRSDVLKTQWGVFGKVRIGYEGWDGEFMECTSIPHHHLQNSNLVIAMFDSRASANAFFPESEKVYNS